jgi:hypothetical protein
MKLRDAGFLAAGAAAVIALALRMAEPPPTPPAPPKAPPPQTYVEFPKAVPAPAPALKWKPAAQLPEATATAPPPVYSQPPVQTPPPPQSKPAPAYTPPAYTPPAPKTTPMIYQEPARRVTLQPGTTIAVRVEESVLAEPVVANGLEIAERGSRVRLRQEGDGRWRLLSFQSSDGQRVEIVTEAAAAESGLARFRLSARITITERRL